MPPISRPAPQHPCPGSPPPPVPEPCYYADTMRIQSQEPLLGLPRVCRFSKLWAVLDCFPRPQAGSWKGTVAAGIRTGAHMGSWACKARTFNHLRHRAGPAMLALPESPHTQHNYLAGLLITAELVQLGWHPRAPYAYHPLQGQACSANLVPPALKTI